jgi:hypothetical protein
LHGNDNRDVAGQFTPRLARAGNDEGQQRPEHDIDADHHNDDM